MNLEADERTWVGNQPYPSGCCSIFSALLQPPLSVDGLHDLGRASPYLDRWERQENLRGFPISGRARMATA